MPPFRSVTLLRDREFLIDNLLEFEFPFPDSLVSTFLDFINTLISKVAAGADSAYNSRQSSSSSPRGSPPPRTGNDLKRLRTFAPKPRLESGLDCLACATFEGQKTRGSLPSFYMAHIKQSRPDSGLGFHVKVRKTFEVNPSSRARGCLPFLFFFFVIILPDFAAGAF